MLKLKFLSFTLLVLFLISCCGTESQPPADVQQSFNDRFAGVAEVEWEVEEDGTWEAEFELDGVDVSAEFSAEGEWLETETEVSTVPDTIMTWIENEYPGWTIENAELVEIPDSIYYEVEIEDRTDEAELLFDKDGIYLKKEGEDEEVDEAE